MQVFVLMAVVLSPILAGVAIHMIRRALRNRLDAMVEDLSHEEVVRSTVRANFFGETSRGLTQVRGNGVLVLTRRALYFKMVLAKREVTIPLESIRVVDTSRFHMGKSVGMRLLRVKYGAPGQEVTAAWWVDDVDGWVRDLERLIHV